MKRSRRKLIGALAGFAALCLAGCITVKLDYSLTQPEQVQHVVLCWLKDPSDTATRDEIIQVSKTFKRIPGVVDVEVGTALPSARKIVDDSFDIGIIIVCRDAEALQGYLDHPKHVAAAEELIRPAARKILVYDIVR